MLVRIKHDLLFFVNHMKRNESKTRIYTDPLDLE